MSKAEREVRPSNRIERSIPSWLSSDLFHELVESFDRAAANAIYQAPDLEKQLELLDSFSDRWDTRQGRERNEATELTLSTSQDDLILATATELGLRGVTSPALTHYDHLLVLGGLVRACIARPKWAAGLVGSGLQLGRVTALGGHRRFAGDEFELAAALGLGGIEEEFAALDFGTRQAFELGEPASRSGEHSDLVGGSWTLHRYESSGQVAVDVAAAPSSDPSVRRANTPDSYAWFATTLAKLKPGQSILMVTTSIYVPAQHAAAIQMLELPYGVEVETVGFEPGMVDPLLTQTFTPTKYLLEMRSSIRAFRRLLEADRVQRQPT
jgi:hypothetical protein